jgi:hypothetical protein
MEKSYQISSGNKTMTVSAPVIARFEFAESAPDTGWIAWLTQQQPVAEGLVLKRIGGVLVALVGAVVGLFGLMFIPGLLFWLLGAVGLGLIGLGIMLCLSKREKDPAAAFRVLHKEAYFNADETAVKFGEKLFRQPADIGKRIQTLSPIKDLTINEAELINFMNAVEMAVRNAFAQYGGPDNGGCTYGVNVETEVKVLNEGGNPAVVQGTVNVIRQGTGIAAQIVEIGMTMHMVKMIGGFYMPANPVPRFFTN